ncbi:MAG: hypothetical protein JNL32_13930 [Candidatus Kapabacteria bacterium]|nr:hypothetical protein [Candidatus Kapabacteria bacterium]
MTLVFWNTRCFAVLIGLFVTLPLAAQNADVFSEQVSYDYMLLMSMSGNTRLDAYGVQPMTVQQVLGLMPPRSGTEQTEFGAFLRNAHSYLRDYYAPLDTSVAADGSSLWFGYGASSNRIRAYAYGDSSARVMGDIAALARGGSTTVVGNNESYLLGRLGARAMGNISKNLGFFADFSNGVRLNGSPLRIAATDAVLSRTLKFVGDEQKFFDRYIGYVQYQSQYLRLRVGRDQTGWGFSPIDNMVHSRNAPLSDGFFMDVPYKSVRFTFNHTTVEGVDIKGVPFSGKFIASHRLQISPAEWCSFAVSDMIVYSGRGFDLAYFNPLAFFVSGGLGTRERSDKDNSLLALDMLFRPFRNTTVYGTVVADDIDFSTITDTSFAGNNNKYAYQVGASHLAMIGSFPLLFTTEYVRINAFTFSHRQVNNSWTNLGAPVGYGMQPNSDRLAVQAKLWFTPRTFLQVDADYTRWGENILDNTGNILTADWNGFTYAVGNMGGNMLRGDGDFLFPPEYRVGNRFLRGRISHTRRIGAWFSSEVFPNIFTDVRMNLTNRNGGNSPTESFWFSFEIRVGY